MDDVPKVFASVIDGILDKADNLLKDEELCKRVKNLSEKILENTIQEQIKKIDIDVQTIKLAIDLEPKDRDTALDIIEDKTRLPQLAKEQNFTIAQVIDATKSIKQKDLATFVKILDVVTDKSKIIVPNSDFHYIEIPKTLDNIKKYPDFFEKYDIAFGKLNDFDRALNSTNQFFLRLEAYKSDEVKYSYSINGTYSSNASDYDILGKELHDAGVSYPKYKFARHHVIPLKAPQTNAAREILYNYDIQINSAANALFLPYKNEDYVITEAIHGYHYDYYYTNVNNRIVNLYNLLKDDYDDNNENDRNIIRKKLCDELTQIKIELLTGKLTISVKEQNN